MQVLQEESTGSKNSQNRSVLLFLSLIMRVIIKLYFSFWSDTVIRTRKLIFLQNRKTVHGPEHLNTRKESPQCMSVIKNRYNLFEKPKQLNGRAKIRLSIIS